MAERISFHDQISRNKWKSFFLLVGIFIVFIVLGVAIGFAMGPDYFLIIMVVAIIISLIYIVAGYYNSDKIALASVKAKLASGSKYPQYHHSVEGLCLASGLPKPRLYVMENSQINAFASGRSPEKAVICVTTGALEKLDKQELEGVIGHELSHIANYDIRYMTLVTVLVGMVAIISEIFLRSLWFRSGNSNDNKNGIFLLIGIVLAILAPIVVYFVQMSISRKREFSADASAVKFTRYPEGLIKALKKIGGDNIKEKKKISKAVAPMFFTNPFKGAGSTHPPISKRISKLERM